MDGQSACLVQNLSFKKQSKVFVLQSIVTVFSCLKTTKTNMLLRILFQHLNLMPTTQYNLSAK